MQQIRLESISHSYFHHSREHPVLQNIDLTIRGGECLSLVGPRGCGKSTLLAIIGGMLHATRGTVRWDDAPPDPRRTGILPPQDDLLAWRDVLGNVVLGAEVWGLDRKAMRCRALELLRRHGLLAAQRAMPRDLPPVLKRRVALVRALALEPWLLLLDEPYTTLDVPERVRFSQTVANLSRGDGLTVILATNDLAEAIAVSDRVVVLSARPAGLVKIHRIQFGQGQLSPIVARKTVEFVRYFQSLWEEMESDAAGAGE